MSTRLLLALLALGAVPAAAAQQAPAPADRGLDRAQVGAAASGVHGRLALNQAAGVGNAQANLAAIALGAHAPVSLQLRQQVEPGARDRDAVATLGGDAFAGGAGLFSINQAAGSGNAQANLFASGDATATALAGALAATTAIGLDDAALAAVAGQSGTEGAAPMPALREAVIENGSFRGSHGVVQVNQTAGVGNASVNAIVLRLPGGTP